MEDTRNFNFKITGDLDRRLKAESDRSGVPMSVMVRRAISIYLRAFDEDSARPRGRQMVPTGTRKDEVAS